MSKPLHWLTDSNILDYKKKSGLDIGVWIPFVVIILDATKRYLAVIQWNL